MLSSSVRLLGAALLATLLAGACVRFGPLVSEARTTASITEDGYLMLTVARNLATGMGMTTAAGTEPTNGVQPAVTWIWAALHALAGGARLPTIRAIVIVDAIVAALTAWCVWRLALGWLRTHPWRRPLALASAVAWWGSPLGVRHTMNGLETGWYALGLAAFLLMDRDWRAGPMAKAVASGVALGGLFLLRNDAIFLIVLWGMVELAKGFAAGGATSAGRSPRARIRPLAIAAAVVVAVASPWLWFNVSRFGHIVPTSGRAESLESAVGEGARVLPRVLVEYLLVVVPLPVSFDRVTPLAIVLLLAALVLLAATWRSREVLGLSLDRTAGLALAFGALLAGYYALVFGAAHFLSRYLFPLMLVTPVMFVAWLALVVRRWRLLGTLVAGTACAVAVAGDWRIFARGDEHPHRPVVEWVMSHVPDDVWVGAPQSGTLGYFHDRTINLDGKVNPRALEARRRQRLFRYIVDETPIELVVDWMGIARWLDPAAVAGEDSDAGLMTRAFEVEVKDPARNLVVLRRIR